MDRGAWWVSVHGVAESAELAAPFGTPALRDRGLRLTAGRSPGQDWPLGVLVSN